MLQHLFTVSFEQQGGYTQVVGVEPFELVREQSRDNFIIHLEKCMLGTFNH